MSDLVAVGQPVIGFRCWKLKLGEPTLKSMVQNVIWPQGVISAECKTNRTIVHEAPCEECTCGIYARTTVEGVFSEYPYYPHFGYWAYQRSVNKTHRGLLTCGAVLMWGVVLRGEKVIKAEHAQVLCLTERIDVRETKAPVMYPAHLVKAPVIDEARWNWREETLDKVAEHYNVPRVPLETVNQYVSEFGDITV